MRWDLLRSSIGKWTLLVGLVGCGVLVGCDMLGRDNEFDVPRERLVAMTAVYSDTLPGGRPVHRLVVADVENPSNYDVLSVAGTDVGRSCFGPEKRYLLFEDNSELLVGSRAAIKLLDLKTRTVKPLNAIGTLKGCVWRKDGSGFYYGAVGGAGLRIANFYDLETGETKPFAQTTTDDGAMRATIPYGRKGRDSILVLADSLVRREAGGWKHEGVGYYFVDAETGSYLKKVENEHFKLVPRKKNNHVGDKYSVYSPAYNDEQDLITFLIGGSDITENIAIASLDGSTLKLYGKSGDLAPKWGAHGSVLFERRRTGIMMMESQTDEVRRLITPGVVHGSVRLANPDY